ncbi:MAG: DUF63 family protein [Candidatus Aenigmarchaeota archaeon]|nr:DUF63 family protein [Candidatus Aenigmarchaeota archaeon]
MIDKITDFLNKYFIYPLVHDTGYNIYNTTVWAIIFVLGVFVLMNYFKKQEQKFDFNFIFALLPWILLGTILRVLKDLDVYTTVFLITPLIYVVIFSVCFPALLLSHYFQSKTKIPYWKTWFTLGSILALFFFSKIIFFFQNPPIFFVWSGILAFFGIVFYALKTITGNKFFSQLNIFVLLSQFTDATSTFIAMTFFDFTEKHVLPRFLINILEDIGMTIGGSGAWIMFPLKLVFVGFALYVIDKEDLGKEESNFLKIMIILLGLAPGIRGLFQLLVFTV